MELREIVTISLKKGYWKKANKIKKIKLILKNESGTLGFREGIKDHFCF